MEYIYHTNNNVNSFCRAHIEWLGRRCSTRFAGSLHCKKKKKKKNHISFQKSETKQYSNQEKAGKGSIKKKIKLTKKQTKKQLKTKTKTIYTGKAFLKRSVFRALLKQESVRVHEEVFHKNVYDVNTSNNVKDILYDTDVIIFIVKLLFIVLWVS